METDISLTAIIVSLIGTAGTIIAAVAVALINQRVKDAQLALELGNAVKNAVGAVQQGTTAMVERADPRLHGVVPEKLVPGVQYVLDHAGEAVSRFGVTPEKVADKIVAQIGLKEIEANIAVSGSSTPALAPPLAPVPPSLPGTTADDLNKDFLNQIQEEERIRQGGRV